MQQGRGRGGADLAGLSEFGIAVLRSDFAGLGGPGGDSLMTGIRTGEARALRWDHVVAEVDGQWEPVTKAGFDYDKFAIYVWRSVRAGGDTKTEKSRRTLELPQEAADALREHHKRQAVDRLAAGELWQDDNLVFCSPTGTHSTPRTFGVLSGSSPRTRRSARTGRRESFVTPS